MPDKRVILGAALIGRTYGPAGRAFREEVMSMINGKWFRSVDGCEECEKQLNDLEWLLPCLIGIMVFAAINLGVVINAVGGEAQAWLISCLSLLFILITIAYIKVGRPVHAYVLKDKKGRRHTHLREPQINKGVFICTGMPDLTDVENMIVEGPIYKIQVRGWGRRRHAILNANLGNWQLLDSPRESNEVYPNLTIDNGAVRLTNISIEQADRIIQNACSPVETLTKCNPKETACLYQYAAAYSALSAVVEDVIKLIESWKGSSNSKIGMGARLMLQHARQCGDIANIHFPAPANVHLKIFEQTNALKQTIIAIVGDLIAEETKRSPKLREFVAGRSQYLPKDEAAQTGVSATA